MASTHSTRKRDTCTLSNYDEFRCTHIVADFALDFKKKGLRGRVDLSLDVLKDSREIVLDTSFLSIQNVRLGSSASPKWTLGDRIEPYGSPLKIQLEEGHTVGSTVALSV